jgi:anti-sigma factor RsiW
MNIDEVTLRAYVDGELSASERTRIEDAIALQPELLRQVEALRASCLPYRAAFDAQTLPTMPAALQRQLASLSAVAIASRASGDQTHTPSKVLPLASRRHWLRSGFGAGIGMAAAFGAGLIIRPMWSGGFKATSQARAAMNPWVQPIASYQAMYVRETVDRAADSPERAQKVLQEFHRQALAAQHREAPSKPSIPNMNSVGLEFRRAQLLGFADKPLLQMAYLASKGRPGALCVLPIDSAQVEAIQAQRLEGLSIVTWQASGLAYVLALDMPLGEATEIGKKIAEGGFSILAAA